MTNASRKLTLLGVILMAASAVTSAILPSKGKGNIKDRVLGNLQLSTGVTGGYTCVNAGFALQCDYTMTGNLGDMSSTSRTDVIPNQPFDDHSTTFNEGSATGTNTTFL